MSGKKVLFFKKINQRCGWRAKRRIGKFWKLAYQKNCLHSKKV